MDRGRFSDSISSLLRGRINALDAILSLLVSQKDASVSLTHLAYIGTSSSTDTAESARNRYITRVILRAKYGINDI